MLNIQSVDSDKFGLAQRAFSVIFNFCKHCHHPVHVFFYSEDGNAPPAADAAPPATEVEDGSSNWADIAGGDDISHLTNDNFDTFISEHESVLVMFYAPCKFNDMQR